MTKGLLIARVGVAFVIAIGAMAGTAANAAIVPTVGLGTATAASSAGPTTAATAAPIAAVPTTAAAAVAGAQGLPSTSKGDPSGPLTILGVALTGIGIVLLRGRSVRHL